MSNAIATTTATTFATTFATAAEAKEFLVDLGTKLTDPRLAALLKQRDENDSNGLSAAFAEAGTLFGGMVAELAS